VSRHEQGGGASVGPTGARSSLPASRTAPDPVVSQDGWKERRNGRREKGGANSLCPGLEDEFGQQLIPLEPDWFTYMPHLLMYDVVTIPKGTVWKRFGPLHIYVPPKTYILALKIFAGRGKDIEDSRLLLRYLKVRTRSQARLLLDRYISPAAQAANAEDIERTLEELFPL
jgi:hypothetical protein